MNLTLLTILTVFSFLFLTACATQPTWSPSSSNRALGVARVAYEHARSEQPRMSDTQAVQLATNRCETWGFARADMIPGELRECSVKNGDSCDVWKVTREYRCSSEGGLVRTAAR